MPIIRITSDINQLCWHCPVISESRSSFRVADYNQFLPLVPSDCRYDTCVYAKIREYRVHRVNSVFTEGVLSIPKLPQLVPTESAKSSYEPILAGSDVVLSASQFISVIILIIL